MHLVSQVVAYLLQQGADATIRTFEGCFDSSQASSTLQAEISLELLMDGCSSVWIM